MCAWTVDRLFVDIHYFSRYGYFSDDLADPDTILIMCRKTASMDSLTVLHTSIFYTYRFFALVSFFSNLNVDLVR